jgi:hypothetical protein
MRDLDLSARYGINVLAVHRQDENIQGNLDDFQLQFGDVMLVEGTPVQIKRFADNGELISLNAVQERAYRRDKAPIAIGTTLMVMLLAAFGVMPIEGLAIIGARRSPGDPLPGCRRRLQGGRLEDPQPDLRHARHQRSDEQGRAGRADCFQRGRPDALGRAAVHARVHLPVHLGAHRDPVQTTPSPCWSHRSPSALPSSSASTRAPSSSR